MVLLQRQLVVQPLRAGLASGILGLIPKAFLVEGDLACGTHERYHRALWDRDKA